ncbi:FHF complex subunit HOOK interacting protein 2A isoform X1 [Hydra vulgaris]|uniref:FHF complex subunit HOOK interacting protein 2A isoform X1 n=2 Tax=Hydra vulgaris TaxID=6087 RepID=UPI001F5EA5D1|nr:FHF complex subunit HOOK interacting protein 2A-like isoform X1 [Hydra vulgaris]
MKRTKKMFTRFTSMLHNAVDALSPEVSILEQFKYHWKCITQYLVDTDNNKISVESTIIPYHMAQMLNVLQEEERMNKNTGPAMEFMLQQKILETLQTLGCADCPAGMKRQVLHFFTNLLGKTKQQILPHVNVHKPVIKMIKTCGIVKAAPTESEEVQFLLQVSSKLKQDSQLVNFFLQKESAENSSTTTSLNNEREQPEYSLVDALLALTKSEDSRVAIKACEGLLLCSSIAEDRAAHVIVLYTAFCERMADQLSKLFKSLPAVIDPADLNQLTATWGFDLEDQMVSSFPGKRQLIAFLSWLDYINQLSLEAHPLVTRALASSIRERFILTAIEPGLSQTSEPCAITVTAILTRCLKLITSHVLAHEFADILLGTDQNPETEGCSSPHKLRRLIIQRVNHLSDQLAVESLRLFNALLHLSYQPIIETLIIRNFKQRSYLDIKKVDSQKNTVYNPQKNFNNKVNESIINKSKCNYALKKESISNITPNKIETVTENSNELAINALNFGNSNDEKEFDSQQLANKHLINHDECFHLCDYEYDEKKSKVIENENEVVTLDSDESKDESVCSRNEERYLTQGDFLDEVSIGTFNKRKVEKTVNGFLLLLPDALKSSDVSTETSYESYLRDAHKQCQQRALQTKLYQWPTIKDCSDDNLDVSDVQFYEGSFLRTILQRLQRILDQPYDINLEITSVLSLIAQYRHPYLHEFLFDTGFVKETVFTPYKILQKVCYDLKIRAQSVPNFSSTLIAMRRKLSGNFEHDNDPENFFFEGVIVLEEFCKELAAIAFVKATVDYSFNTSL